MTNLFCQACQPSQDSLNYDIMFTLNGFPLYKPDYNNIYIPPIIDTDKLIMTVKFDMKKIPRQETLINLSLFIDMDTVIYLGSGIMNEKGKLVFELKADKIYSDAIFCNGFLFANFQGIKITNLILAQIQPISWEKFNYLYNKGCNTTCGW